MQFFSFNGVNCPGQMIIGVALLSFRYVWESKADGSFAISEDSWNEPLGRGTEIRLHLRDEAKEYLEEDKLKVGRFWCFHYVFFLQLIKLYIGSI